MSVDAAAADRLPWLPDDPAPQALKWPRGGLLPWGAAAVALVAAGAMWMGATRVEELPAPAPRARSSTTVALPPPHPLASPEVQTAQPEVRSAPLPEVHLSPLPEMRMRPRPVHRAAPQHVVEPPHKVAAEPAKEAAAPAKQAVPTSADFVPPKPWNPRAVQGAAGRLVQVGAFGSVHQAKHGWWFMVRDYPAMAHLPAVVRETHNSIGRTFYRFDVGTTSQAHSEVLCQRMIRIGLSCAVVGLPWKAKVER